MIRDSFGRHRLTRRGQFTFGVLVVVWSLALAASVLFCVAPRACGADDPVRTARVALALRAEPTAADRDRAARVALAVAEIAAATPTAAPRPKGCSCGPDCPCAGACKCDGKGDLAKVRDAVVRVRCGNASGSGTVVWSKNNTSVVLTAAHVIAGGGDVTVRGNGATHKATALGRDDAADLAALLVAAELPAVAVAETDPRRGDEVLMVGVTSLWSRGKVLGPCEHWDGYLLGYDSDAGDSGAGVFAGGQLVAVHCGKTGATADTCTTPYAAGARPIRAFLARIFRRGEPTATAAAAPVKPAPPADDTDLWLIDGRLWRVPKGQAPPAACPSGRCPAQR